MQVLVERGFPFILPLMFNFTPKIDFKFLLLKSLDARTKVLNKSFKIETTQSIKCKVLSCLNVSKTKEITNFLFLEIIGNDVSDLDDCLSKSVEKEKLDGDNMYFCEKCNKLRIASKRKNQDRTYYCTAFPIGTLLASTWDKDLVESVGNSMGNEALNYGIDIIFSIFVVSDAFYNSFLL